LRSQLALPVRLRMRTSTKLIGNLAVVAAALAVAGVLALQRASGDEANRKRLEAITLSSDALLRLQQSRAVVLEHALGDGAQAADAAQTARDYDDAVGTDLEELAKVAGSPEEAEAIGQVRAADKEYAQTRDKEIFPQGAPVVGPLARPGIAAMTAKWEAAVTALEKLHGLQRKGLDASMETQRHTRDVQRRSLLIAMGVGLLLVAASMVLARAIVAPLAQTREVLLAVAEDDLSARVDKPGTDEIGQMSRALNTALEHLNRGFHTFQKSAQRLSGSTAAITNVADELARAAAGTAEQTKAMSESSSAAAQKALQMAAGARELDERVKHIAGSTGEVARAASAAVEVSRSVASVASRLGESSTRIGDVVKTINAIAGQTRLLALNATIEAARAGEAGAGFAVVADEVKELANATTKATEEIARVVASIQADSGAVQTSIGEISEAVQKLDGLQGAVAQAINEHTTTSAEIGASASAMESLTSEMAVAIDLVAKDAEVAAQGSRKSAEVVRELAEVDAAILTEVGRFKLAAATSAHETTQGDSSPVLTAVRSA
jgi:methyl-accepting chemotaxis protein